jgi:hypothetical protein
LGSGGAERFQGFDGGVVAFPRVAVVEQPEEDVAAGGVGWDARSAVSDGDQVIDSAVGGVEGADGQVRPLVVVDVVDEGPAAEAREDLGWDLGPVGVEEESPEPDGDREVG